MNTEASMHSNTAAPIDPALASRQYLAFTLGGQEYGVDILRIQEIRGQTPITPLPQTPPWVKGAMNLRGSIVPVFDLRTRFGLPTAEYHRFSVIIVVSVGPRLIGLLVDAVSDVVDLGPDEIEPAPNVGGGDTLVEGLGRRKDRLLILLDLERVVA
jgi:purine-binding chemotaxis protein CheW